MIHALKYGGWRDVAPLMAERMASAAKLPASWSDAPVVVPVPTTRRRERKRGYNQSRLLAQGLADAREWPLVDALERPEVGRTQVALSPAARLANVDRAFVPAPGIGDRLEGRCVVLIDDVLTTGATASAAASALERVGVRGVTVVAFARAIPTLAGR